MKTNVILIDVGDEYFIGLAKEGSDLSRIGIRVGLPSYIEQSGLTPSYQVLKSFDNNEDAFAFYCKLKAKHADDPLCLNSKLAKSESKLAKSESVDREKAGRVIYIESPDWVVYQINVHGIQKKYVGKCTVMGDLTKKNVKVDDTAVRKIIKTSDFSVKELIRTRKEEYADMFLNAFKIFNDVDESPIWLN